MPKGRRYVPPVENDGIWFQHRGLPDPGPLVRERSTCTGDMLSSPFREESQTCPQPPPPLYKAKDARNFKKSNSFSAHDNRHSFQDHGVYFGDGRSSRHLGKQLLSSTQRQHHTDRSYLRHAGRVIVEHDYNTVHATDYRGEPTAHPPVNRRFPRVHREGSPGLAELTTSTTLWQQQQQQQQQQNAEGLAEAKPYRTPLHVLAVTQEPFLPHNTWKYSNHGLAKCYPTYDQLKKNSAPYRVWHMNAPHVDAANRRLQHQQKQQQQQQLAMTS